MKIKLLVAIFFIVQLSLLGQLSIINFKYKDSKLDLNFKKDSVYPLDLALIFPKEFDGKKVYILDSLKSPNFILKLTFGKNADVPFYGGREEFRIVIDTRKVITGVSPAALQGVAIKQNGFYIRIDDEDSDLIKISSTNKTTPTQVDYTPGLLLYDAIYINNQLDNGGLNKIRSVLKHKYYAIDQASYNSNQYLYNTIGKNYEISPEVQSGSVDLGSFAKSVGGLDVTTIADGFAKFIVKRTKKELSIAFFDKFQKEISKSPDLKSLFPATYKALDLIGDKIYMFEAYIHLLRESFEKDLSTLPSNLPSIIENHETTFNELPELKSMLQSGFYIAQAFQDKQHPGEIIENYPIDILDSLNLNIKAALQTLQLVSTSVKSKSTEDNYWAPLADIKKLYAQENERLLNIYLGLLEQRARLEKITFIDSLKKECYLYEIIDKSYSKINAIPSYRTYIKNFAIKVNGLETKINSLNLIRNDSLLFESYYNIVTGTLDIMKYITKIETLPEFPPQKLKMQKVTEKYFDIIQTSADLVIDVNRRNYASAIVNTAHIIDLSVLNYSYSRSYKVEKLKSSADKIKVLQSEKIAQLTYITNLKKIKTESNSTELAVLITKAEEAYNKTSMKTYSINASDAVVMASCVLKNDESYAIKLIQDTIKLGNEYRQKNKAFITFITNHKVDSLSKLLSQKILKYGTFMATVVQAKNSDDVEAAIEAIALPTGSARIKRQTPFSVALNAYCGMFMGWEQIKGVDRPFCMDKNYQIFNSYGVTAPIGISISTNIKGWSLSAFGSIVDIGAITAFRFANDSTESVPKIELKDIISPGAFLSVGIPKTPLSINMGYQVGPLLRKVNQTTNTYQQNYSRVSVSICVDLPLLNFYSLPKKND